MLGPCEYRPAVHHIIECPLQDWLERQTTNPALKDRLFIYRHADTGNFIIACWLSFKNFFRELFCIGPGLSCFDRLGADRVRWIVGDADTRRRYERIFKASEDAYIRQLQDESDAASDKIEFSSSTKVSELVRRPEVKSS